MSGRGFYDKYHRLHDTTFMITGIERPNNKALCLGRAVGMNRVELFGTSKADTTQMSYYNSKYNNEAGRSPFRNISWKVMVSISSFSGDNQWLVH